jgi:predicted double-glycine peptidase
MRLCGSEKIVLDPGLYTGLIPKEAQMNNPVQRKPPAMLRAAGMMFVTVLLGAALVTAGCRNAPQTNIQDQPVLTSAIENFIQLPLCRQATDYTCGAAALQSIFYYYGDEWDESSLAAELQSDPETGTNYRNIIKVSEAEGLNAEARTNMTIDDLKSNVRDKKLVIVAFQAWSENPGGYADDWNDGHYAIVVGYGSDRIYFMDPLQLGNYTYILNSDFLTRWHDTDNDNVTRLENFGIVIWGDSAAYDPAEVVRLK